MKKYILLPTLLFVIACSNNSRTAATVNNSKDATIVNEMTDSINADNIVEEEVDGDGKSLNDIRFAKFKDEDWLDNDYIRQLRKYLDDYNSGKIKDDGLDPYKDKVKGEFVIWNAEPFLLGGLFIQFVFIDSPDDIFSSWVYSDVDEETESVTGYEVHGVKIEEGKSGFTKERILQIIKEEKKLKLW